MISNSNADLRGSVAPGRPSTAASEAKQMLRPLQADIIDLLKSLVQTNSVAVPSAGSETAAQKVLLNFLKHYDLHAELYDLSFLAQSNHPCLRTERNYAGRHNLVLRLNGTGSGRSLMLSGHMDTVPPGLEEWKESPWSGAVHGDRLYGRGSYDMKGGLVAVFAVAIALKKASVKLNGDLICESVIDEEWAGGGGTLGARLRGDIADACVIAEPTDLAIFRASRGGHFVDIEVQAGDSENYFSDDEVVSPAMPLGRLLGWIEDWAIRRRSVSRGEVYQNFSDPAPVQVLAVEANTFDDSVPWSVPLNARVRLYFQFLPHEDVSVVIKEIEMSFSLFCAADPFFTRFKPTWKAIVDPPLLGHELSADHEWTKALSESAAALLDTPPVVTGAQYPCDAFLNQLYFGMPTLIFGPSGGGAHNANEFVELSSVFKTAEVLLATTLEWCGTTA